MINHGTLEVSDVEMHQKIKEDLTQKTHETKPVTTPLVKLSQSQYPKVSSHRFCPQAAQVLTDS